jgi:hypothetical protein
MKVKTASEIKAEIQKIVNEVGIAEAATRFGLSEVYIYKLLRGERVVSSKVAAKLGYTKIPQPKPEPIFTTN